MKTKAPKRGRPPGTGRQIPPAKVLTLHKRGLKYEEIAAELSISKTDVSRLLTKARAAEFHAPRLTTRLEQFIAAVHARDPLALELLDEWHPQQPEKITLPRTGAAPLRFSGTLFRQSTSRADAGTSKFPDFWRIRIFKLTKSDTPNLPKIPWAVSIDYSTTEKNETPSKSYAIFTNDPASIITQHNPAHDLIGLPKLPKFAEQQEYLDKLAALRYGQLVSKILRKPIG